MLLLCIHTLELEKLIVAFLYLQTRRIVCAMCYSVRKASRDRVIVPYLITLLKL